MSSILLYGATGYTGKLIAQHLVSKKEYQVGELELTLGGRDAAKLHRVASTLTCEKKPATLVVDMMDFDSVEDAVKRFSTVIQAAGPYNARGEAFVRACARTGCHYVDLSGEPLFSYNMIRRYDYAASKSGAILIPNCAFDSVPSDLTAFLSVQALKSKYGSEVEVGPSVTHVTVAGSISGGTLSTFMELIENVPKEDLKKSSHPWSLSPYRGPRPAFPTIATWNPILKTYGGVWFMEATNLTIVHRTVGLFSRDPIFSYGPNYTYNESWGHKSYIVCVLTSMVTIVLFVSAVAFTPARWLIKLVGPDAGNGPSPESLKSGSMEYRNIATATLKNGSKKTLKTTLVGTGDPGYALAAVMIAEAAVLLALSPRGKLGPLVVKGDGGILTPATALGVAYKNALEETSRMKWQFEFLD